MGIRRGRPVAGRSETERDTRIKVLMERALDVPVALIAERYQISRRTVQLWVRDAKRNRQLARVAETLPYVIRCAKEHTENERVTA
jgi:hypothetical protein